MGGRLTTEEIAGVGVRGGGVTTKGDRWGGGVNHEGRSGGGGANTEKDPGGGGLPRRYMGGTEIGGGGGVVTKWARQYFKYVTIHSNSRV